MSVNMSAKMDQSANITLNETSKDIDPDAFKYWIHCNKCFDFFFKKTSVMYLLSCHHILCASCIVKQPSKEATGTSDTYKCAICSNVVRARIISNDLPSHLKELFHPTPWLSDLPTARIVSFQDKHRGHLFKAMENLERKCIRREQLVLETIKLNKKQENELRMAKHENVKLERQVRPVLAAMKNKKRLKDQQVQIVFSSSAEKATVSMKSVQTFEKTPFQQSTLHMSGCARTNAVVFNRNFIANKGGESSRRPMRSKTLPPSKVTSFAISKPQGFFHL